MDRWNTFQTQDCELMDKSSKLAKPIPDLAVYSFLLENSKLPSQRPTNIISSKEIQHFPGDTKNKRKDDLVSKINNEIDRIQQKEEISQIKTEKSYPNSITIHSHPAYPQYCSHNYMRPLQQYVPKYHKRGPVCY